MDPDGGNQHLTISAPKVLDQLVAFVDGQTAFQVNYPELLSENFGVFFCRGLPRSAEHHLFAGIRLKDFDNSLLCWVSSQASVRIYRRVACKLVDML